MPDSIRVSKAIDVLRGADEPPAEWPTREEIDEFEQDLAEWPAWTDERWTIGPDPADGPTDADWDEHARVAEWQDRLEAMHRVTDDDLRAAGLPVG
jgi:hypothetical protein